MDRRLPALLAIFAQLIALFAPTLLVQCIDSNGQRCLEFLGAECHCVHGHDAALDDDHEADGELLHHSNALPFDHGVLPSEDEGRHVHLESIVCPDLATGSHDLGACPDWLTVPASAIVTAVDPDDSVLQADLQIDRARRPSWVCAVALRL